jgi:hypothetical protein
MQRIEGIRFYLISVLVATQVLVSMLPPGFLARIMAQPRPNLTTKSIPCR